jgi:general secretion pathway protein J
MRREAGFTLLEMLVALVVFGLVMAGLAQSFRFGLAAWSEGPARTAQPENLAALDAALTQMIMQTVPNSFTGEPNQLSFTTRLPAGAGLQDALADAAIMPGTDGTLILRYRLHPPGILLGAPPVPKVEVLAQGVSGFSVSYLTPGQAGAGWTHKVKSGKPVLLVRIHLDFVDGRNWPDLVAAPVNPGS